MSSQETAGGLSPGAWRWVQIVGIPMVTAMLIFAMSYQRLEEQQRRLERLENMLTSVQQSLSTQERRSEGFDARLENARDRIAALETLSDNNRIRAEQALRSLEALKAIGGSK